ncbi:phosphoribosylglycinamide formyltransferase [Candidatus Pantoea edessiphila]|uniref:Phosphoribosylglycinamide formyltransferase n=1 Tax=Candidatus Pantoea edessiphila TaxID=2044610 RepID=A0A2P5SWH0_9GAMM|nr:phosphoribosylglycinamide formyltransferase [Candidatus Pantoea edessiphila]PPI86687.1 phosphoribosylglycinamide formyltransferase [Candidatus Pantoea edessiphila]
MKKIVTFISGVGSNLKVILDACQNSIINARIASVFSNISCAYGLTYAKKSGIPINIIDVNRFINFETFDFMLTKEVDKYKPDLIVLAGYMRILGSFFVNYYKGRIMNIHPSLLPKYPGLNTHCRVLENGELEHGSSVHFVTDKLDSGPIIIQSRVPVLSTDDKFSLKERVKSQEYIIYPIAIKWYIETRLIMKEEKVWLDGKTLPPQGYTGNIDNLIKN